MKFYCSKEFSSFLYALNLNNNRISVTLKELGLEVLNLSDNQISIISKGFASFSSLEGYHKSVNFHWKIN
ncbi:hypothetical protein [Candidatus Uabimicrobium sp. HlEnr_7]|uniref:hypothetical protein n=1 Tax=Candidatus Uabimicrobium helgolandensis TaxID=3095367 RepID=UPI003557B339